MGDVVKAVQNIGNEVAKGVNNVTAEAGKGFDNLVKGDVGKAAQGLLMPQVGLVAAGSDVLKGDIKGAVGRAAGAQLSGATNLLGVSSDLKRFVGENDTLNTVTLGMASDAAKMHDSTNRMVATGEVRPEDVSNIVRAGGRAGIIATGVGLAAGAKSALGTTAINAGKSGAGFLQGAGSVAAGTAALVKNPGDAIKNYLGVDTSGFDDFIDNFNDIRGGVDTVRNIISPPSTQRSPATTGTTGSNAGVSMPMAASGSLVPIVLMVAGGLVGLVLFLKRKK